jgi:hypothetical protein
MKLYQPSCQFRMSAATYKLSAGSHWTHDAHRAMSKAQVSPIHSVTLSERAGVRALTTHPLDEEVAKFYLDFGFVPSPAGERNRGPQRCRQWHCVGDTVVHRTARETT